MDALYNIIKHLLWSFFMEQQISSDLIRGHIDTIILHSLNDGDKFAQQISDFIDEKSDNAYKINQATLYSSLKRLESLKHVKSYWNDSDSGRRKYFSLTESGKNFVETNMSNWSYSRAIIDKLMDCAPQPIYKTEYVEKIVEVTKEVPVERIIEVTKEVPVEVEKIVEITKEIPVEVEKVVEITKEIPVETPILVSPTDNNSVILPSKNDEAVNKPETPQEINFRNILNGLIKVSTVQNKVLVEELEPLNKQDLTYKNTNVDNFNETISTIDYNAERNNNGKIDFGDLTLKAAKEGYKIRISSKDSYIAKGTICINKINFFTSLIISIISIVALLGICVNFASAAPYNKIVLIAGIAVTSVFFLYSAIKLLAKPKKTVTAVYSDSILTAAIVVFDLILIAVAANLLLNVDFSDLNLISYTLILPVIYCVLSLLYYTIRFAFSKTKLFITNAKK